MYYYSREAIKSAKNRIFFIKNKAKNYKIKVIAYYIDGF